MRELLMFKWDEEGRLHLGFIPSLLIVGACVALGSATRLHADTVEIAAAAARAEQAERDLLAVRVLVRSKATCDMVPVDPIHVDIDGAP